MSDTALTSANTFADWLAVTNRLLANSQSGSVANNTLAANNITVVNFVSRGSEHLFEIIEPAIVDAYFTEFNPRDAAFGDGIVGLYTGTAGSTSYRYTCVIWGGSWAHSDASNVNVTLAAATLDSTHKVTLDFNHSGEGSPILPWLWIDVWRTKNGDANTTGHMTTLFAPEAPVWVDDGSITPDTNNLPDNYLSRVMAGFFTSDGRPYLQFSDGSDKVIIGGAPDVSASQPGLDVLIGQANTAIGFYGHGASAQQVVPTSSNTSVIVAALQALGLVKQS